MPYPNLMSQLKPLGDTGGFDLVWNFVGANPLTVFLPAFASWWQHCLYYPAYKGVGSLFLATVLTNVVCFNFFYNVR